MLTYSQIWEFEDLHQDDIARAFAEAQDAYVAAAWPDATFDFAFDTGLRRIVLAPVVRLHTQDFASLLIADSSALHPQIVEFPLTCLCEIYLLSRTGCHFPTA